MTNMTLAMTVELGPTKSWKIIGQDMKPGVHEDHDVMQTYTFILHSFGTPADDQQVTKQSHEKNGQVQVLAHGQPGPLSPA